MEIKSELSHVDLLADLLKAPIAERDEAWELQFLREFACASVSIVSEDLVSGPDGWPYLMVATGGDEPVTRVVRWLSTRGVGMVVNPEKAMPDFAMSYGMVWNCRERGEFLTAAKTGGASQLTVQNGQQLFAGAPSLSFLPEDVRVVLREFLARQKVTQPKVVMLSADQENWDLVFSVESLGHPPKSEHAGIAEAISWFLPAHYSVGVISESVVAGFVLL